MGSEGLLKGVQLLPQAVPRRGARRRQALHSLATAVGASGLGNLLSSISEGIAGGGGLSSGGTSPLRSPCVLSL